MKHIVLWLVLLLLGGCISTKTWKANEYLLAPPVVRGNKILPPEDFAYLHRQKPNGRLIFWSKVGLYQYGARYHDPEKLKRKIDTLEKHWTAWNDKHANPKTRRDSLRVARYAQKQRSKLEKLKRKRKDGNWLMRVVGEKPVFYDSLDAQKTATEMVKLLRTKGFFQGKVALSSEMPSAKYKRAVYDISENVPTFLDTVIYRSSSPIIDSILHRYSSEKHLKKGDYYNTSRIDSERYRIEQLLRNNGFMLFSRQYINFSVDTTHFRTFASLDHTNYTETQQDSIRRQKREARITVLIEDPAVGEHKTFSIDGVFMHQSTPQRKEKHTDTLVSPESKIRYIYVGKALRFEYQVLDKRIHFLPAQLYSAQKIVDTQNALNSLDMYKFVNVKTDTLGGKLHLHIFTSPLDRYQLTFEGGSNMTQGLPGPFVNLSLKARNVFGGAEFLEISPRFLIDGQSSTIGQGGAYTSREVGVNTSLNFPRILFPNKLLPRRLRENVYAYNPITRLSLGYGFVRRPEYTRSNLVAAISYKGQLRRATYNFTLSELSLINTSRISEDFQKILDTLAVQGNPIKFSFAQALVGSTYFIYTYTSTTDVKSKNSYYFRVLLEVGGNSLRLLDRDNNQEVLGLPYFQFYRINPTFHYYIPRPRKHFWAFRLNVGVAIPYGQSSILPYEKYFFAGGSSSLRAWRARKLGVGGLPLPAPDGRPNDQQDQPGEIIIEGNAEYRFPLYQGWIEGATFVDVGNVWSLQGDNSREGGVFNLAYLPRQIALGTGFGVRFDFSFLVFRVDMGLKIHDPGRSLDSRWVLTRYSPAEYLHQRLLNINIAVGYPF